VAEVEDAMEMSSLLVGGVATTSVDSTSGVEFSVTIASGSESLLEDGTTAVTFSEEAERSIISAAADMAADAAIAPSVRMESLRRARGGAIAVRLGLRPNAMLCIDVACGRRWTAFGLGGGLGVRVRLRLRLLFVEGVRPLRRVCSGDRDRERDRERLGLELTFLALVRVLS
jgi:hypothetical protein